MMLHRSRISTQSVGVRCACGLAVLAVCSGVVAGSPPAPGLSPSPAGKPGPEGSVHNELLVVHEWGTFTSLQDETGRAIPGINTDEEALPRFVHRLSDHLVVPPSQLAPVYYKGVPRVHRDVTMRLETPVIYFHLPPGRTEPLPLDVRVRFRGGWLTEFYPNAKVDAPGVEQGRFRFGQIRPETIGSLEWKGLTVGGRPKFPETDSHVWLAPRQVNAAAVQNRDGDGEQYLFYRGVGHLDSPLRVTRNVAGDTLTITEQFDDQLFERDRAGRAKPATTLWLAHIRDGGTVAWRSLGTRTLALEAERVVASAPATFDESDYAQDNLDRLRIDMLRALVADGLFPDEAQALLATWELGYFRSPGLRLFFLLPQEWTDAVLPLDLSVPADVTRTMVGRVEIVTPEHRRHLGRISAGPVSDVSWFYDAVDNADRNAVTYKALWEGKAALADAKF
ncbi:MAG TPA: hypothetical protein VML55_19330, partial [Planctomycetaceae bacterium]|nr:hypothetical protein [Planctomycetaceae bacterium]